MKWAQASEPTRGNDGTRAEHLAPHQSAPRTRSTFNIVFAAALLALVAALIVNSLWLARLNSSSGAALIASNGSASSSATAPPDSAADILAFITPRVLGYETIARQPVPGELGAGEGVYATLQMSIERMQPTIVRVRVKRLAAGANEQVAVDWAMKEFSRRPEEFRLLMGASALGGFTADEGAYAIAWSRDGHLTTVEASYRDVIPAGGHGVLRALAVPVAESTNVYQVTGVPLVPAAEEGTP